MVASTNQNVPFLPLECNSRELVWECERVRVRVSESKRERVRVGEREKRERVSEREKEREKSVYVCVIARVSVCCFEFCISFDEWKLQLSLLRGVKRVWSPFEGRKVRNRRKKETQNCNFIWKKLLFYARSKDLRNKMQERSIKRFDDSHFLRRLGINAIEIFKGAKLTYLSSEQRRKMIRMKFSLLKIRMKIARTAIFYWQVH